MDAGGPPSYAGGDPRSRGPRPDTPRSSRTPEPPGRRSRADQYDGAQYGDGGSREPRGRNLASRARDLSRSMSQQLSAMMHGAGRVARREAQAIAHAGGRPQQPMTPPPGFDETQILPRHRRSRIRMRARKWRLGRIRQNPVMYFAGLLSAAMLAVAVVAGGAGGGVYAYNYYSLHKGQIAELYHSTKTGGSTVIYDRNGQLLYTVRSDNGFNYYRPLSQINPLVQKATIDIEDHTFYAPTNIGIDFQGTLRALYVDLSQGGAAAQGGSTITQQLVKNLVLHDTDKAVQRKLNEIILAIGVTESGAYTKQNILEMYLNTIDYGDQNQGIEAAARNFFGIKPGEKIVNGQKVEIPANTYLTLPQIALLVGLPNAPSLYLPIQYSCKDTCADTEWASPCVERPDNPQGACTPNADYDWTQDGHEWQDWMRARDVLDSMVNYGDITQDQRNTALQQVHDILQKHEIQHWAGLATGSTVDTTENAPSFVEYVKTEIYDQLGVDPDQLGSKGWSVYTTLDYNLDQKAAQSLQYYINGDKNHLYTRQWYCPNGGSCTDNALSISAQAHNGALVAIDPRTGDILAMVGSVNYGDLSPKVRGQYNVATHGRQLGSSVKPVVYATAFQMGWNPATILQDQAVCYPIGPDPTAKADPSAPACKGWYVPHNYESNYAGRAPVRENLANSLNIAATETLSFAGGTPATSQNVIAMAQRLGIDTWDPQAVGPTTALGDQDTKLIDLTSAFGTFANGGKRAPYRSILMIKDADGNVIYPTASMTPPDKAPPTYQVVSPQVAYELTSILTDNDARAADFGSDNPLYFGDHPGIEIAAKTGTASGKVGPSNIVTMGYSPYLALGVWVGNSDGSDMTPGIIGITGAGYVFHDVMEWSITHYKWAAQSHFPVPPGMARGTFNCITGLAPYKDDPNQPCRIDAPLKNLYSGYGSRNHSNTDWYIQGQAPTVS
jgi:membrane peptidoglycan carboxypeptidase